MTPERSRREKIAVMWTAGVSFDAICTAAGLPAEDVAMIIYLRSIRIPEFINRSHRTMAEVMAFEKREKATRKPKMSVNKHRLSEVTTPALRARLLSSSPGATRCQGNSGGTVQ